MKVVTERLETEHPGAVDALLGYVVADITGALRLMHGYQLATAIFGTFERVDNRVRYTATVWTDENGTICHNYDSEFADDLICFRNGQCVYEN